MSVMCHPPIGIPGYAALGNIIVGVPPNHKVTPVAPPWVSVSGEVMYMYVAVVGSYVEMEHIDGSFRNHRMLHSGAPSPLLVSA